MKFSEIPIGTFVMFNGQYAVKIKKDCIQIPKLGVDGFHHITNDEQVEIIVGETNEHFAND